MRCGTTAAGKHRSRGAFAVGFGWRHRLVARGLSLLRLARIPVGVLEDRHPPRHPIRNARRMRCMTSTGVEALYPPRPVVGSRST